MKKITLLTLFAIVAMQFTSCGKLNEKAFVGTWGVEKIEYYNIDYAGHPIEPYSSSYTYDPNSSENGIQMIFHHLS